MTKLKLGDIVRISTSKGYAYALYTHKNAMFGSLLTVFKGFYPTVPDNGFFDHLGETQFTVFFPLQYALKNDNIEIVGNVSIPKRLRDFPVFRTGLPNPATNKVDDWWLWDGINEWHVGKLSSKQWKFPVRELWNDTLLIENIESNWSIDKHPWGHDPLIQHDSIH